MTEKNGDNPLIGLNPSSPHVQFPPPLGHLPGYSDRSVADHQPAVGRPPPSSPSPRATARNAAGEQALKGSLYMVAILVSFLIGGTFIMQFFGISIPGLRITGGILLTGIGLDMLRTQRVDARLRAPNARQPGAGRYLLFPAGHAHAQRSGSIAVTLGFTSLATGWLDYVAIIAGIVTVAIITYIVLRVSGRLVGLIGPVGVSAMTKIMGFPAHEHGSAVRGEWRARHRHRARAVTRHQGPAGRQLTQLTGAVRPWRRSCP